MNTLETVSYKKRYHVHFKWKSSDKEWVHPSQLLSQMIALIAKWVCCKLHVLLIN